MGSQLSIPTLSTRPPRDLEEHAELGAVFTRGWVVDWILDLVGYLPTSHLHEKVILEPSCGEGAFLTSIVGRLVESCQQDGASLIDSKDAIWASDLSRASVEAARTAVSSTMIEAGLSRKDARELASSWIHHDDFLLGDAPSADWVVGNPPYVRLEDVGRERMERYRADWPTMIGRADIYVGFYERGLRALRNSGRLGFICADRWMRNSYGRKLRELISRGPFSVKATVKLHDVDCFEEEVSSYPAITVIERRDAQADGAVVDTTSDFAPDDAHSVTRFLESGQRAADGPGYSASRLDGWFGPGLWPEAPPRHLQILSDLERDFPTLEDPRGQTKVGIGVATGADSIFITEDESLVEPGRLLPLAMAEHIADGDLKWSPKYLVNPWSTEGLVDPKAFPRFADYLNENADALKGRHVGKKNPTKWFRTIDRVNPALTDMPKVLLADMKAQATPVVDPGGLYPHHNLYWITSTAWPIESLAGFCLSDAMDLFVRSYCVKMRGGTLRFQAQYLRTIHVPAPSHAEPDVLRELAQAYENRDRERANAATARLYGVDLAELRG